MKKALTLFAAVAISAPLSSTYAADTDLSTPLRPVTSAYMLMGGSGHLADTYLTPLHYTGYSMGFLYQRSQAMKFNPQHWTMQLSLGIDGDIVQNPAKNADMYAGSLFASWTMMHRWNLPASITLGAGPGTSLDLGVLYLERNGNNPASAKAAWTVDANAYAGWNTRIGSLPVSLRYSARLPITGAFFAPDYGQLYYQIYLGDRDHLAHAAWWGNYFRIDNMLTADLHFGNTSLRIGYRCDIFSSKASGIVTRDISHMFVLGVVTEWLSIRPGSKKLAPSPIISAY